MVSSRKYSTGIGKILTFGKEKDSAFINKEYNDVINGDLRQIGSNYSTFGEDSYYLYKYKCETDISSITGRVYKVIFTQK